MNNFSGIIPSGVGELTELRTLNLYNNTFQGIPPEIGNLVSLEKLDMTHNEFVGAKIPEELGRLKKLKYLRLANSDISGRIPESFANLSSLEHLDVMWNNLEGTIPTGLFQLNNLLDLSISHNKFSGNLPSQFPEKLESMDISFNRLSGQIPPGVADCRHVTMFLARNNEFTGQIPPELGRLRLTTLDLSFNNLRGKIPFAFDNMAYHDSFLGNSNLCSNTAVSNIPRCSSSKHKYIATILVPGAIVLLMISCFIFFNTRKCREEKNSNGQLTWELTPFHNLDFSESTIVSGLTENNVIGSGGSGKVYRININGSADKVAVKRIWDSKKVDHALEKQFVSEVEILGTIRHTNIVKLLCCISSEDSKLLVYEYMENQSLDQWLRRKKRTFELPSTSNSDLDTVLGWPTRLRIAVGAAKGLCYMHHNCYPAIIHRDVKSSNILLDREFNAKIADFGLAKMSADKTGAAHTASSVAGSFGYIAPEYWRTRRLNEKIDIYSYGVVLLELATGKEPSRGDDHLNLADWSWRHHCEGRPIEDAIDEEIKEPCFLEQMKDVFKLGLMCTSIVPSSRPSMKQVLQLLSACSCHEASDTIIEVGNEDDDGITPFSGGI